MCVNLTFKYWPNTVESGKKRLTTAMSLSYALYSGSSWEVNRFSTKEKWPNLCQGGEDLIRGHGLKRVFFPHRTWQVLNVANTFAPIAFLKCGLQLQGSRGGVNPTKWTQVQITRVASPEKWIWIILLINECNTWILQRWLRMSRQCGCSQEGNVDRALCCCF